MQDPAEESVAQLKLRLQRAEAERDELRLRLKHVLSGGKRSAAAASPSAAAPADPVAVSPAAPGNHAALQSSAAVASTSAAQRAAAAAAAPAPAAFAQGWDGRGRPPTQGRYASGRPDGLQNQGAASRVATSGGAGLPAMPNAEEPDLTGVL